MLAGLIFEAILDILKKSNFRFQFAIREQSFDMY